MTETASTPSADRRPSAAIRVVMMPRHTNAMGTIFGGIILSYIDQAGAVEGHRHTTGRLVTVAMREVEFIHPVHVGDLVSFYARTQEVGTTSITVNVAVEAERQGPGGESVRVTEAEVVYVHLDDRGRPVPLTNPQADAAS